MITINGSIFRIIIEVGIVITSLIVCIYYAISARHNYMSGSISSKKGKIVFILKVVISISEVIVIICSISIIFNMLR